MTRLSSSSPVTASSELGRTRDAGPLEDGDLGRVAADHRPGRTPPRAARSGRALLDQRHLVAEVEQRARDVRADLASAGDDRRTSGRRSPAGAAARTVSSSVGDRRLRRADDAHAAIGVELRARRVEHADDDACRSRSASGSTWPITMFVLSPFVATTAASASATPARSSTVTSMPCPTTNPPRQPAPSRASASSSSSTTVTSQPSAASPFATAEPTRPHPITTAFTAAQPTPRTSRRGTRRRAPRTVRCGGRSRRSARRTATAAATAATSRARSGRRRAARPRRRSRGRSSARGRRRRAPRRRDRRRARAPRRATRRPAPRRRPAARPRARTSRGTRTTVIASIAAPRSFASAIAVATISSPMSPSFIGTRMRSNSALGGSAPTGATCSKRPRRLAPAHRDEDDEPGDEPGRAGVAGARVRDHREHPDRERQRRSDERGERERGARGSSRSAARRYGRSRSGSRMRSRITASCAAVNAMRTPNE